MATWRDVEDLVASMPDATLGEAHEGSPAWYAGRHQFARRRDVDGHAVVQLWSGDLDLGRQLAPRSGTFVRLDTFEFRVSVWVRLDRIGRRELAELLLDSYRVRGGARRAARVDQARYFGGPGPADDAAGP
ncbi:hypothetical protein [Nocardioides cynanchi]|uniref:hypothetical protein n=1 Tax=Nocardioides cynanchi TaxID=2558918 RepID=UPI0012442EE6|nr:hypothetical protein [Nocardioides cynanchi]